MSRYELFLLLLGGWDSQAVGIPEKRVWNWKKWCISKLECSC